MEITNNRNYNDVQSTFAMTTIALISIIALFFIAQKLYIQGIVRNGLQYRRLYDENGNFRSEVGARAVYPSPNAAPSPADATIKIRRATGEEEE